MRTDDGAMSPRMAAVLSAVDAALAGEPVAPEHADVAELALLLRDERPRPDDAWGAQLDARVERRFRPEARAGRSRRRWRWLYAPGAALAAAAAGVAVVFVIGSSGGHGVSNVSSSASAAASSAAPSARSAPSTAAGTASTPDLGAPTPPVAPVPAVPAPVGTGGRQIVQSAQLQLAAAPSQIDTVANQVFSVVASEKAIVQNSNVTSGGSVSGDADFELSVPSANLEPTLNALSHLRGARVLSRTDSTSDITGQVGGAGRRLAEARALRTSLLRQLAAATTTDQVNSLQARIHDADASINSDLATLHKLQHQVAYSLVSVTISGAAPPPAAHHSGGFTIGRAAHDAGRVLVVVAGVALIALAVLVPLGLLAALGAWLGHAVRRRRREQALDMI